ncbi:MAG: hypothetical protein IJ054_02055 [Lachnospiraceae bacterium]|nr:hypothetical protein [Lachnospiraceae bacterium]MBQ9608715.1 hypothetical protein [Lachnospiraceae bacterium]
MKKKLLVFVTSLMIALAAVGCGSDKNDKSEGGDTTVDSETAVSDDSLAAKARFVYNGVEFGAGDKASEVVAKLGDQIKPSEKSQPCVPGSSEIETYYFPGFTFDVSKDDVIFSICLTNDYDDSKDCTTVGGVGIGKSLDDAKSILGTDNCEENEFGLTYTEGDIYLSVSIDDDGNVFSVRVEDTSIEF